jgi:RNA polymerase sigma-B factor
VTLLEYRQARRPAGHTSAATDGAAPPVDPTRSRGEYAHLDPLLARYAAISREDPRRRGLREELVAGFYPVVQHIARRYRDRGEPTVDLEQVGAIGLLGALERFDPGRGPDFLSFLIPTITGEIRKHFRDRTWAMRVPRRLKDLHGPVLGAIATLSNSLGRAPRPSEIAAHLDIPVDEIVDVLNAQYAYRATSLDALVAGPGSDVAVGDLLGSVDAALSTAGHRHELRQAFAELPERERTILALRFFEDLTQTQIAAQVGLSQMHVSRLLARSLALLHARLDS